MAYLSNADMNFLMGNGPTLVSSEPKVKKQGNGNFTGFILETWSDGTQSRSEFVVNAASVEEVQAAYFGRA